MIVGLSILIGAIGLCILLVLLLQTLQTIHSTKKYSSQSKQAGMVDLLNYASLVDDGVIVCKNGSLMAAWMYSGEDNASSTNAYRNIVSFRVNNALKNMGSGWMIHVDAIRKESASYSDKKHSHFPDPISQAIENERRAFFETKGSVYESVFVLTITYFPPNMKEARFIEMLFDDDKKDPSSKERTIGLITQFERDCQRIENDLSTVLEMHRLKGVKHITEEGVQVTNDDFLRYLHLCVTGKNHPVRLPDNPMYLDSLIGAEELYTGVTPKIGNNFIQCISIEGFPLDSTPGILTKLSEMPCQYRWNSRFIFMDHHEALSHLEKYRKKWKQKVRGFMDQIFQTNSGTIDEDALSMVEDAQSAIAELNSGMIAQGYYTSVVVIMHPDRDFLQSIADKVKVAIEAEAFSARIETINNLEAFMGSLPGHGVENVRRPLINTMNLADLLPTSSIWNGREECPCPLYPANSPALMHCVTSGNTPFRLNLHIRDLGHTMVFGPTRAGKSTFLATVALQMRRYPNMTIYAFDKGLSMLPACKAVGGNHFTIGDDNDTLNFSPLQFLDTQADQAWAMDWIESILALNDVKVTPGQRNEIAQTIVSMSKNGASTITEFCGSIQDLAIREALTQYKIDGMMGTLLDADKDGLSLSKFTVFEIEELMDMGDKYALPVLLYLFRRIERSLHGQPTAIFLDEAWLMLDHPVFRKKIREWLKAFAKKNCLVILATQNLTDAANSGILDVIVESTATKIFLPNIYARDEDSSALYRRMGLNDRQIEIISNAIPKRQYYYVSESGRRIFELALGPVALAFVGATDKESIATIKQLEKQYGRNWAEQWLSLNNVNYHPNLGEVA